MWRMDTLYPSSAAFSSIIHIVCCCRCLDCFPFQCFCFETPTVIHSGMSADIRRMLVLADALTKPLSFLQLVQNASIPSAHLSHLPNISSPLCASHVCSTKKMALCSPLPPLDNLQRVYGHRREGPGMDSQGNPMARATPCEASQWTQIWLLCV